ncbi:VOC family protein [Promicromonospora sp. CA-289599]|uniref:VOC family protein n=1 Tax=Promicromonospora sp. CA-289599 TaxID=3240014 RepID=UPI003D90D7D1
MDYRLEVLTLPVKDVETAITFYRDQLGFHLDVDWAPTSTFRVAQLTPPGSATSVQLGTGITDASPGSATENYLVVTDAQAAHRELTERGAAPGPLVHKTDRQHWTGRYASGPDPDHTDYSSSFVVTDPDGNTWRIQERGHPSQQTTTSADDDVLEH